MKTLKLKWCLVALMAVLTIALPSCKDEGESCKIECGEMSEGMNKSYPMERVIKAAVEKENTKMMVSFYTEDEAIEEFEDFMNFLKEDIQNKVAKNQLPLYPDCWMMLSLDYETVGVIRTEKFTIERR